MCNRDGHRVRVKVESMTKVGFWVRMSFWSGSVLKSELVLG